MKDLRRSPPSSAESETLRIPLSQIKESDRFRLRKPPYDGTKALAEKIKRDGQSTSVRVEEFINYFRYDYDPPEGEGLFSIQVDGSRSPFDATKHLLRLGIQAKVIEDPERMPANLVFLVDSSCSMNSDDRLGLAKRSLARVRLRTLERDPSRSWRRSSSSDRR